MKYVYPKFDGINFFFFRLGGSGFGNLLYPYFRAIVYSKQKNLQLISPIFPSIKIGPYLRGESQKRVYTYIDRESIRGLKKFLLLKLSKKVKVFKSFGDGFKSLYGYEDYLKEKLKNLSIKDYDEKKFRNSICCHIRLGDFKPTINGEILNNTRIPISWYIDVINDIRRKEENLKVYLFSDGNISELIEILKLKNVYIETSDDPITDILKLSSSKYFIGSYSSFSFWSAFFSKADCYWHKDIFNTKEFPQNSKNHKF